MATAQATEDRTIQIRRELDGGAIAVVYGHGNGVVTVEMIDHDGDRSMTGMDRAQIRTFIADLTLAAGLAPTPPKVERSAALLGSTRILFERLVELDAADPTAADEVIRAITSHMRSWRPAALVEVK